MTNEKKEITRNYIIVVGTKNKKKATDTCEEPLVYDGFLPLWDRKWLFEGELWIFDATEIASLLFLTTSKR